MTITYAWKSVDEIKQRMEPSFWVVPDVSDELAQSGFPVSPLGQFIAYMKQGDVPRKGRGEKYEDVGITFIEVISIIPTGIDFETAKYISRKQHTRLAKSRPRPRDVLLVRSGKGSIGKVAIVSDEMPEEMNISGHINLIRVEGINPYYVATVLKSSFGQVQIERLSSGVSRQVNIGFAKIRSIHIPVLPKSIQLRVEERYKQMSRFHHAAMEAKAAGNEAEHKEKLAYAEQLLDELITYVEKTIRARPQALKVEASTSRRKSFGGFMSLDRTGQQSDCVA